MASALLEGLSLSSQLLLQFAVRQEVVPLHLGGNAPLVDDPDVAVAALQERGLVEPAEMPGLFTLTPMGYALRPDVLGSWRSLHVELRGRLVAHLAERFDLAPGCLLRQALSGIDRADFVREPAQCLVDLDMPIPTGVDGMTTSAPHAIVEILRAVAPERGERVLVCGAKGGVTAALAAHMVGPEGQVVALDWDPRTVQLVRNSVAVYPQLSLEVRHVDDVTVGAEGPWDCAVLNGSVPKIPRDVVEQLAPGGRVLFFLQEPGESGQSCYVLGADGSSTRDEALSRFVFTPLYGRWGWDRIPAVPTSSRSRTAT